jgi:signal transduction histidine kinase
VNTLPILEILLLFLSAVQISFLVLLVFLYNKKSQELTELSKENAELRAKDSMSDSPEILNYDYISMLVHELRSPLSVIKGASDLIIKEAPTLTKDQIEMLLSQIRNSSGNLLNLVNDILDVSKLHAGRFEIKKTSNNLPQLIKETVSYLDPLLKIKSINANVEINGDLPLFAFDADRIRQVLNNLLSNAVKFTPKDGLITVSATKRGEFAEVQVRDTGGGIPDEEKPKIFHKFVQVHNNTMMKEKGTGLGLVISKGIVETHGGKIWVEDNKPKGTIFVFTLPIEIEAAVTISSTVTKGV